MASVAAQTGQLRRTGHPVAQLHHRLRDHRRGAVRQLFLLPLVWAVLRSFQPPGDITATPERQGLLPSDGGELFRPDHREHPHPALRVEQPPGRRRDGGAHRRARHARRLRPRADPLPVPRIANAVFALILVTLMVPFQAILTPLFLELSFLHLLDSRIGLILFYSTFNLPFGVFVMRNSFTAAPNRARGGRVLRRRDGAHDPALGPAAASSCRASPPRCCTRSCSPGPSFSAPSPLSPDINKLTLPVALLNVETGTFGTVNFGFLIAGAVIAMVPCAVLYVALQRFYVTGITAGGVKG